jgi:hypothetical protein
MRTDIKLNANDIQNVRALYTDFQYQEQKALDSAAQLTAKDPHYKLSDFQIYNINVADLFSTLDGIAAIWGGKHINFGELEHVFSVYMKYSPNKSPETLSLFSTLFELVAKILEHKGVIYKESIKYNRLTDMLDSTEDIIFPDHAA